MNRSVILSEKKEHDIEYWNLNDDKAGEPYEP